MGAGVSWICVLLPGNARGCPPGIGTERAIAKRKTCGAEGFSGGFFARSQEWRPTGRIDDC
jgi:hypothetical protein